MPRIDLDDRYLEIQDTVREALTKKGTDICLDCWESYIYPRNGGMACDDHPSYSTFQVNCALCGVLLDEIED